MKRILERNGEDLLIIHCGDFLYHGPRNPLPGDYDPAKLAALLRQYSRRIESVRGNCDSEIDLMQIGLVDLPEARTLVINDIDLFISHGHKEFGLPFEGGIIISGHTHVSHLSREGKIIFLNPGSSSIPKDGTGGSYAIIDFVKGAIYLKSIEGLELKAMAL
ncbi:MULTISPECIES: phosphodiesterase [unclassified Mesotoga]|uniref:phosphodiesterase n=1 Tax=unclassified Mesotoga TaxID=1184398 RepID=UPI0021AC0416|nr:MULTISPECIES: phosphodiesterase [unclassified Mesotoga]